MVINSHLIFQGYKGWRDNGRKRKKTQRKFESDINSIVRGSVNHKSKKVHLEILKWFTKHEKKLPNFDYRSIIVSDAKHALFQGEWLKILTPK